ncbi:EcoRI family type II restriction endonuclease [Phocicoccus pinnipedialis]|uniref:Type-2 restriction enzyme EcoRI n=1 Tax=Phocicoccus pinnipedialis TaxID=110845 RepID=A0A6V7RPJ0_9BACL|nr:EcoRI family type II restriction endonuclease [Jeotgalicoccus pinnipedialis]MBP1940269.1 type II restriction enzyme [Jeotgalicoccus pinnipedialis]CAD2079722.1 Type-2 restriction enzyme EcoRI [Jeotgalicoccus pinnipedialis]
MKKKNQSERLTNQHKKSKGVIGIFGELAKKHDVSVRDLSKLVLKGLENTYPELKFRFRASVSKKEINDSLKKLDNYLGQTLFVEKARITPDGGFIEVQDDNENWRIILVSEAKFQGKDIENIKKGNLVGKNNDQDIMHAGNAIERSHKNISEVANYMLSETHFPYVIFLEGSNFLTETVNIERPDGRVVELKYHLGSLNRLDRLSAANYGMPFNTNLCKNRFVSVEDNAVMLQAASMYTTGDGRRWEPEKMLEIMLEIANMSLQILGSDIFLQLTANKGNE